MANRNEQNENGQQRIPENDPSKAMDSKKEVENSNDEKIDQDFPGYPHYPSREDIMDQRNGFSRENLDVENLPNSRNVSGVSQRFLAGNNRTRTEEPLAPGMDDAGTDSLVNDRREDAPTDSDVTEEDLAVLNSTNGELGVPQNVSNVDLDAGDLPGTDLDEETGSDDEDEGANR